MAEPVVLFGAFDRHNFGDLLLARIAERLVAPRPARFAGLAERDLTPWGGPRVEPVGRVAKDWGNRRADLVHVGGELLTCTSYQAAVMLQNTVAARAAITRYDADPAAARTWAARELGVDADMPYLADTGLFRQPGTWVCNAVGGVDLANQPDAIRAEVAAHLRRMMHVGVRDTATRTALREEGLDPACYPDPAVLTATLFGADIERHAQRDEPARVRARYRRGYVAVQFSAEHGDDATLRALAVQLERLVTETGLGLVLFRAGAAPWHDDLEVYRRLHALLPPPGAALFESLHVWDICALLAHAAAYCGTSLHGRVAAECFAVPAVNLADAGAFDPPAKTVAYARTWARTGLECLTCIGTLADTVSVALRQDRAEALSHAQAQAALYRQGAGAWRAQLGLVSRSAIRR